MPIFELGLAIPVSSQKSCVKNWFRLVEPFKSYHLNFPWGQKHPIRGVTCDLQCPFSNLAQLFQSKVICVNLVRIGWAFQELSCPTNIFLWGKNPVGEGVTFDLWCPYLNSDELFQSKVMCGNLVWIGWNWRYVNFEGRPLLGGGGYMWPAMPIFELGRGCLDKSCVKIWFGLVEAFKSYRGYKPNEHKDTDKDKNFQSKM